MPYIPQDRRNEIQAELKEKGLSFTPQNAGDLNFLVSQLIENAIEQKGLRYANLNEFVGALECCKLELYRVLAAPYEDQKIEENGAVYTAPEATQKAY